jgi:photosystem II stability/assembly factor-like uncharacterized protein
VYKTIDAGAHWTRMSPRSGFFVPEDLAVAPSRHQTVYALGYEEVWRTTDGGRTWREIDAGLPADPDRYVYLLDLAVSGSRSETAFVATPRGVFRTSDGGRHWSEWNRGLGVRDVTGISLSHHHVYASTRGGGVYERSS